MELLNQIGESVGTIQGTGVTWAIVNIIVGALGCFLGYKLMRLWIVIGGALGGFVAGYYIAMNYTDNALIGAVAGILSGIILAMIAYNVYLIGVFLLCGTIGLILSSMVIQPTSSMMFFICVIIGVITAVLSVRFVRPMIILTTSFQGGLTMASGIVVLCGLDNDLFMAGIGIAIAIFGCAVQFLVSARNKGDKSPSTF